MTDELITWLRQQLDEDERVARAATAGPWRMADRNELGSADVRADGFYVTSGYSEPCCSVDDAEHIARWNPARVLAEVEARRRIVELHQCGGILEGDGYPEGGFSWCTTCGSGEPNEYPARWPCATVLLLARPYAGQPGWREEWRV